MATYGGWGGDGGTPPIVGGWRRREFPYWGDAFTSLTQNIPLPATVFVGDVLILLLHGEADAVGSDAFTVPGGWTLLGDFSTPTRTGVGGYGTGVVRNAVYYRIADGTEGATVTVTGGAAFDGIPLDGSPKPVSPVAGDWYTQWWGQVHRWTGVPQNVSVRGCVATGSLDPSGSLFNPTVPAYTAGGVGTVVAFNIGPNSDGSMGVPTNGYYRTYEGWSHGGILARPTLAYKRTPTSFPDTGPVYSGYYYTTVIQFGIVADPDLEAGQASTATDCDTAVAPVVTDLDYYTGNWPQAVAAGANYVPLWGPPTPDCLVEAVAVTYEMNEPFSSGTVTFTKHDPVTGGSQPIAAVGGVSTIPLTNTSSLTSFARWAWSGETNGWTYATEALHFGGPNPASVTSGALDPSDTLASGFDVRIRARTSDWDGFDVEQGGTVGYDTPFTGQVPVSGSDPAALWSLGAGTTEMHSVEFHGADLLFRLTDSANVGRWYWAPGFTTLHMPDNQYAWIRTTWDATSQTLRCYTSTTGASWTLRFEQPTPEITALRSKTSAALASNKMDVGTGWRTAYFGGQVSDAVWKSAAGTTLAEWSVPTEIGIQAKKNRFGWATSPAQTSWVSNTAGTWSTSYVYPCGTPGANPGPFTMTYLLTVPVVWEQLRIRVEGRGQATAVSITPFCSGATAKSSVGILLS